MGRMKVSIIFQRKTHPLEKERATRVRLDGERSCGESILQRRSQSALFDRHFGRYLDILKF
jgi:hypothetical protein